ncbi:thrombospondin type-1 domain-containing protein 1 [Bos javanicus]|uniref:thrombospondin type-1 domain-containing protein 1 n=1 Tax=Bos javanicus TaxID=9906 RepID=UPI002AA6E327|nr:thrombospondin type-1 domain-containing protein 1 [Bos javanicus]
MKQTLKDFSNLLLVVLCDYVLGEAEYLVLGEPGHVALSNSTVTVDFHGANGTLRNVSVLLVEASSNQTLTTKYLLTNQSQGTLEFECFYFKEAGDYWFVMTREATNSSLPIPPRERSAFLKVEWPVFHVDLSRTSMAAEGTFQVGLFTSQPLCPFPGDKPDILLEVTFTNSLPEARAGQALPLEIRASKRVELAQGQWVEFDCPPVGPEAYVTVTVVLKLLGRDSVIMSTGPIDLAQKFGYKLVMEPELTCEAGVEVTVLPPPCIFVQGVIAVFKEAPRLPGERTNRLAENSLALGERRTVFNCTLFDMGRNKYCFDFGVSSQSQFSAKEKECMLIRRSIETWGLWQPWSQCSASCGDGVRERRRVCLTSSPSRPGCPGMSSETSPCSLEDCAAFQPSSPSPLQPQAPVKSNNVVTVTAPFQANAQKIIPPLFSYRLAQQQLKEMKKKGLTETTKVYHVSQSPLTDTAIDAAAAAAAAAAASPGGSESPEEAAAGKFRIKSPFLEHPPTVGAGDRPPSRLDHPFSAASCAVSPSQTLLRKSQVRSHSRGSHFRRTASFHEARQARPFRERSLSTLTPRPTPAHGPRARTWDQAGERGRPPSRGTALFPEKRDHGPGAAGASGPLSPLPKPHSLGPPPRKPDLGDRQAGFVGAGERPEPPRARRGPSPSHRSVSRKQPSPPAPKDGYQRVSPLSPSQGRKDKCQSFPAHPEFAFYDNTSFGLTEAEQRMLDLPGYFGSNEEDETTSTLSVEKLVI